MQNSDIASLIERVEKAKRGSNHLDVLIEVALFKPDSRYKSVRPNDAEMKVIYKRRDGREETFWAHDYTSTKEMRGECIAALRALQSQEPSR